MNRALAPIPLLLLTILLGCRAGNAPSPPAAPVQEQQSSPPSESPTSLANDASPSLTTPANPSPQLSHSPLPPEPQPLNLKELFPGIRIDAVRKVVEFDGEIAIDCHNPQTPRVYLEVLVCTPDTREHESIVVTRAKPSLVHAALLAVGLHEGRPGSWEWNDNTRELIAVPPGGDAVEVALLVDGVARSIGEFAVRADNSDTLTQVANSPGPASAQSHRTRRDHFVFAGSTLRARNGLERYEADGAGTLVGLTTFGTETIAWSRMYSPDSSVEEPAWIANAQLVPPRGAKVVVRVTSRRTEPQ